MKTRNLIVLSLLALIIGISSCRDDLDFDLASNDLSFSTDTINLDTIFNHTNSQTYKFTVHNNQDEDVEIPRIALTRGVDSFFKLNVDGMSGYEFENVPVRKNDSIYIFVEIAAGEAPINPNYEDEIIFETTGNTQQVKLLSYIERAEFHITPDGQDYLDIDCETWDNSQSHVIFGNVRVLNCLTINPGTKIYFHDNSGLTVNSGAIFDVNGNLGNEVIFRTDRMDERSDSLPKMWDRILLKNPEVSSKIDYAVIKGGTVGLEVEGSTNLKITNTKILNNDELGLYAKGADIKGYNLVINNSDVASLAIEGGSYDFRNCSIGNFHNIGQGAGNNYSLFLSNDGFPLSQANFYNCVFYGRASNAIVFDNVSGLFNHDFKYNVMRLDFPDEFPTNTFGNNNLVEDPLFVNPGFGMNDLRFLIDSPAIGHASFGYLVPETMTDIMGVTRTSTGLNPGAYEGSVNPDE